MLRVLRTGSIRIVIQTQGRALSTGGPWQSLDTFEKRHIGVSGQDVKEMLKTINCDSLEDMVHKTIPASILWEKGTLKLEAASEADALQALKHIASKNKILKSAIGAGYFGTKTPTVILRNILENPGWYTSYTPYQPEIAQGRLEMLLNYQTMISNLTGLEYSNASLLDESTAAAEAFSLSHGAHNGKRMKFFVDKDCHPQTIDLIKTRAGPLNVEIVVGDALKDVEGNEKQYSGVIVQYPNTHGVVNDYSHLSPGLKKNKTNFVVATDPLALCVLKTPGEMGADVAVGSAQRFGVPMFFGGPHAGFMAVHESAKRKLPGRIVGVSRDRLGNPALRLALQAREQHIRRGSATSNICTAQALLANTAAAYAIYHGPGGLRDIANRVHEQAVVVANSLSDMGHKVVSSTFFDTVTVTDVDAGAILKRGIDLGMNLRQQNEKTVSIALDETFNREDIITVLQAFGASESEAESLTDKNVEPTIPDSLSRTAPLLDHPVFNTHHSESQMLRYLAKLEGKDFSLKHGMMPLGSCTMKLNATSEMIPISWPEFANMHPFAPSDQTLGYQEMISTLNTWLCKITGFAAISEQPNSGANGEYAGLLAIRNYHRANGDDHRNVCLIPSSAHGTNPASAAMCGMKIVVVDNCSNGGIDLADFKAKAEKHKDNLAALMITYPSTFGVFDEEVREILDVVHGFGGQVYMDGANMNAQVGLCSPGTIGADVCHLNLHKTFCIPHGGGGPGVGSIGVAKHLAPHLPGHAVVPCAGTGENVHTNAGGAVAGAPFGSAGILPISWMYIKMLGGEGLWKATTCAILNANYMAKKLEDYFPIKFKGRNGYCAHEFIIDARHFKEHGIVEEDIAKRLMDYGFHAPTMSWPVPGTLMIEPTESEDKEELDRLIEALKLIHGEIHDIIDGKVDPTNNVMKNAPHTDKMVCAEEWNFPYTREKAAFPTKYQKESKFWPTVARIDNVYGDRNLVCSCPPMEMYMEKEN